MSLSIEDVFKCKCSVNCLSLRIFLIPLCFNIRMRDRSAGSHRQRDVCIYLHITTYGLPLTHFQQLLCLRDAVFFTVCSVSSADASSAFVSRASSSSRRHQQKRLNLLFSSSLHNTCIVSCCCCCCCFERASRGGQRGRGILLFVCEKRSIVLASISFSFFLASVLLGVHIL